MSFVASIIAFFVMPVLSLILFVFLAYVIMSWLFILNIASPHNPTVRQIYNLLSSVVDPIVGPFRKVIPPLGSFDMGFYFAFMLIYWVRNYILPQLIVSLG